MRSSIAIFAVFAVVALAACGVGPVEDHSLEASPDAQPTPDSADSADAAPTVSDEFPVEVLHYNIGNGAGRAGQDDVIRWLEDGETPAVITLNELCGARFQQIEEVAAERGYVSAFFATNPDGCGGSNAGLGYGNALFVRGVLLEAPTLFAYESQEPNAETRNLGCVTFTLAEGSQAAACVTHLENNDDFARDQAAEALAAATALRFEIDGGRVFVGGDFNLQPSDAAIAQWRDSAFDGVGQHLATYETGKTIDYIFATRSADTNPARTEAGLSDHFAVRATIWNY